MKVPAEAYDEFLSALDQPYRGSTRIYWHTIRRGDTMAELARTFNVSVRLLRHYNQDVDPRRMQIGTRLMIPLRQGPDPERLSSAGRGRAQGG